MEGIGLVYFQYTEIAEVHYSINGKVGVLTPLNVDQPKLLGKNNLEMQLKLDDDSTLQFFIIDEVSDGTFNIKLL